MTVADTFLALVVAPLAIYGLITLLVMWPRLVRSRPRSGQEWDFDPVFWVANPVGVSTGAPVAADAGDDAQRGTARGGARGKW